MLRGKSKYRAVPCRAVYADCEQGHASLKEHRRAMDLRLLERAGEIRDLREQVRLNVCDSINVECRHKRPIVFVADFVYLEPLPDPTTSGDTLWAKAYEDSTGVMTVAKRLKTHLLADQGIEVRIS